ncbi:MAG: hypothetical protein ACD_7C00369G0015 [uncultured bacterium]|nr:MAG: hypothetical protein ACD_7C00369G0015 [uncultured bacterium]
MLLAISLVCFFAAFGFGFVGQSFTQQDFPSAEESQVFTDNDRLNLERAIEQENWETAIFYCEKSRRRFRAEVNALEAKIKNLAELLMQFNNPNITARVNTQLKELDVVLKKTVELTRKDDKMLQDLKRIAMEKKSLSGEKA